MSSCQFCQNSTRYLVTSPKSQFPDICTLDRFHKGKYNKLVILHSKIFRGCGKNTRRGQLVRKLKPHKLNTLTTIQSYLMIAGTVLGTIIFVVIPTRTVVRITSLV